MLESKSLGHPGACWSESGTRSVFYTFQKRPKLRALRAMCLEIGVFEAEFFFAASEARTVLKRSPEIEAVVRNYEAPLMVRVMMMLMAAIVISASMIPEFPVQNEL
jgi:hypothetical protein